ncbi:membrane protein [Lactobacillus acidophilus]|nr:membrane protein [Lactobacillus acidophilus]
MLKSKRHFIFLGAAGLIYYSWLLIVLFIAIILGYEGNKAISVPGIIVGLIFILLAIYTWRFSYFEKRENQIIFKLPYRTRQKVSQPVLYKKWRNFQFYRLKGEFQSYSILIILRKRN